MSDQLHIASVVVHHRPDAADALDQALAAMADTELALREGGRSVLVLEGPRESVLLDRLDALRDIAGVIGVSLVHHHAEAVESLLEELPDAHSP